MERADERLNHPEPAAGGKSYDGRLPDGRGVVSEETRQRFDRRRILQRRQCLYGSQADRGVLEGERLDQALDVSLGLQLRNVGGTEERHG